MMKWEQKKANHINPLGLFDLQILISLYQKKKAEEVCLQYHSYTETMIDMMFIVQANLFIRFNLSFINKKKETAIVYIVY